jgi:glycerophosphoryl diester phosphodiesterase
MQGNNLCTLCAFFAFTVSLMLFGCKKDPSLQQEPTLNGKPARIIGHGGMGIGYKYPMNSFESLSEALDSGVDGIEMDVQMTADSVLVLYHGKDLETETGCNGQVRGHSYVELKDCNYERKLFAGPVPLITAEDFFRRIGKKDFRVTLECKIEFGADPSHVNRFARNLAAFIEKHQLVARSYVESYNLDFLRQLKQLNDSLRLFVYAGDMRETLIADAYVPLHGVTIDLARADASFIQQAHKHVLEVSVFNVRTERDNVKALNIGADNIQTDKVRHLVDLRR